MTTDRQYYFGLGRRKTAVARVRLYPGAGTIVVNGKPLEEVIPRASQRMDMLRPLTVTETERQFNVQAKVSGGGTTGWAGAIRHGIARALLVVDEG
ncbi:MAG: 30S ribosomal protein S9, partial [Chloroflexi bacterium]|nr:30S ribosomal protein S9 [Chloroflexota bacterium]